MYLQKLLTIIGKEREKELPTCITDLVENGLSQDRFTDEEFRPGRHEITLFLAAWCRRIGLDAGYYRDWLIDYSFDVLGGISKSSPSQIRHSTKSTIKYVHRSDVAFSCHCQRNIFKAVCGPDCPLYWDMETLHKQELDIKRKRLEEDERIKEEGMPILEKVTVKQQHKEQFEEAGEHIQKYLKESRTRKEIVDLLKEKGYKTSTGREWTIAILNGLIKEKEWVLQQPEKPIKLTVKQQYKEQFEEAVKHIQRYLKQGLKKKEIADLLNEKGYKTRIGREWKAFNIN